MKIVLLVVLLSGSRAFAQVDPASEEALQKTQQLLENSEDRQAILEQSPNLKKMDQKIDSLSGGDANKQEIYNISSQVMKNMVNQNAGDAEKMKQVLENADKDPQKFFDQYFDESQKKAVRDVSSEIEKTKKLPPANPQN